MIFEPGKTFYRLCVLLCAGFLFGSCVRVTPPEVSPVKNPPAIIKEVPEKKIPAPKEGFRKTHRIDQIKVIEKFNNKSGQNELGGTSRYYSPAPKGLNVLYKAVDAISNLGLSLWLEYSLKAHTSAFWETQLNNLDVSQAEWISFWFNAEGRGSLSGVSIAFADNFGGEETVDVSNLSAGDQNNSWNELLVPVSAFKRINFNNLVSFRITINAGADTASQGVLGIDNIVFIGPKNLFFNSLKDNLFGFPEKAIDQERQAYLLTLSNQELMHEIAKDTWKFFDNTVDKATYLPLDFIQMLNKQEIGDYTSPTNIGLYLMCCVGAYDLGLISKNKAIGRITRCLETVETLLSWKGFPVNFYNTTTLKPTSKFVSTVDCGWYAAGLIVVRNAFDGDIAKRASDLLNRMDFGRLYDSNLGQLRHGYDLEQQQVSKYHYGVFCTEARVTSLISIAKKDVEKKHWFRMYRALPSDWTWQQQIPCGTEKEYLGQKVFQSYYVYDGEKIVPSWGGSLFEFLMPTLVVNERILAARSLGLNNEKAVAMHIKYALDEKKYPVWGISPCSVPSNKFGDYAEFGIAKLGVKGYPEQGIATPHASLLALDIDAVSVIKNIRSFLTTYPIYGEYGLYDSVNVTKKKVSYSYLTLDQGMIFISLVNYLANNSIKERFHNDPLIRRVDTILSKEEFF